MKYFTIAEMIFSRKHWNKIWNKTTPEIEQNLTFLGEAVLDPLREKWGKPITVSSGYRCPAINRAENGVSNSQHLKGEAADIVADNPRENVRMGRMLVGIGRFDQVIFENCNAAMTEAEWIHVSVKRTGINRRQVLRLVKGSKKYESVKI